MNLNYEYRLYPDKTCINRLESTLEACRFVYNYFIDNGYENEYDMNNALIELKELYPELRNYHSKMLQMVSKQVAGVVKALKELKKQGYKIGIGSLNKKDKYEYNTFIYNQSGFKLVNNNNNKDNNKDNNSNRYYLWLSKIGYIRINMHRPIPNGYRIKQVIITRKNNSKWYAIFTLEQVYPIFRLIPITLNNIVALDMNSTNNKFIIASNNDDKRFNIDNTRLIRRLRLVQRKLSRRKEGSNNYKKAKSRLQIIHERIKRRRDDLLHKLSRYYARYNIVFVEDLNVKKMLEYKPLPNGNNTLHRNIANKAFSRFIQLLSYKTKVIKVNPNNTTKECYRCNNIQDMQLHERIFKCSKCNLVIDRDRNSSLNILKKGLMKSGLGWLLEMILPTLGARGSYAWGDPLGSMNQEALPLKAG